MFDTEEIPTRYIEEYKTLHHDIGLVRRSNGSWDLWFGQDEISKNYKNATYLNIIEGDLVSATEIHSLQVGIIVACLTSWNYLNRTGNPIYTEFGNESYSLLKKNKGVNTKYKIKHYFIQCLERMRRVYNVESLDVYEIESNPYIYKVKFKVLSITNTIVDGEFYLNTDTTKSTSMLDINYNHPYTSVSNPLYIECVLKNEYGSFLEDEVVYIYIKNSDEDKFKFYGITDATNYFGRTYLTIPPKGLSKTTQIMLVFKGNSIYNPCISKIINIESVAYYIKSKYTYKTIKNENDEDVEVVDKHILYVEDSLGDAIDKFRLGELLSDNVTNIPSNPSQYIQLENIIEYLKPNNTFIEYDENENIIPYDDKKLYLIPSNQYIEGTNKPYYVAYSWDIENERLILSYNKVQLNTNEPNEIHFLIEEEDNGLFEIDFNDGHLYYKLDIFDNEL